MNIIRCWSQSVGYFFNPRQLFKELSDYFSVAYKSLFLFVLCSIALSFDYVLPATVVGIYFISMLKTFIRYFFVVYGRDIQSLTDVFTCIRKNLVTVFYLMIVIQLGRFGFYYVYSWIIRLVAYHGYAGGPADFATIVGYLFGLLYPLLSFYALFVFDGVGYGKSVAKALSFYLCNLPLAIVWMVLEAVCIAFFGYYLRSAPSKLSLLLLMASFYVVSYCLFAVVYLYYERMKKYVR